jgi:hypothetical protein
MVHRTIRCLLHESSFSQLLIKDKSCSLVSSCGELLGFWVTLLQLWILAKKSRDYPAGLGPAYSAAFFGHKGLMLCVGPLVQFDVTYPHLACSILSLDAMDVSGEQHLDVVSTRACHQAHGAL